MRKIDLEPAPSADIESARRSGRMRAFVATGRDPRLAFRNFPEGLPYGLYKLEIETPDGANILDSSVILAESGGDGSTAIRTRFERRANRVDAYFVLPENTRALVFAPIFVSAQLHLGAIGLRRVSTTLTRASRALAALRRRITMPSSVVRDLNAVRTLYREDGLVGLRRKIADVVNPTTLLAAQDVEMRVGRFGGRISIRNRATLDEAGPPPPGAAASLSIVVPVYRTPEAWLAQLLDSLNGQSEQDFELVLVFDGPQDALRAAAELGLAGAFRRVLVTLPENRGVSAATNAGIQAASGDYVVVVDHDDVLEAHFVEAFRFASGTRPADIYFADEAITDTEMSVVRSVATRGKFDIRFYLSHPYIVHPIIIRRALATEAGLLDEKLRVSHDVDFFLRCLAKAETVVQIPMLLYFWRTHDRSLGHSGMDQVASNTRDAIRRFLEARTDWPAFEIRDGINFNEYDVRPPLPTGARAAIVIPTKNGVRILSACLRSLEARKDRNTVEADIYVIDHGSDDPATLAFLAEEEAGGRIRVVPHAGPWNYSAINNAAVRVLLARERYSHLVFMNNDIEVVTDDWLDRMVAQFSYGDVGVVGCCLEYPDGRVQHGGVVVGLVDVAEHAQKFDRMLNRETGRRFPGHLCSLVSTRDYSAVTAAMMIVPADLFQAVGGFDEELAVGFGDTDLCLRIGALGFHSTYVGLVVAVHHESVTRGDAVSNPHPEDTRLFSSRYGDIIRDGDEYYGLMMDWSSSRAKISLKPQKSFRLRESKLRERPAVPAP